MTTPGVRPKDTKTKVQTEITLKKGFRTHVK